MCYIALVINRGYNERNLMDEIKSAIEYVRSEVSKYDGKYAVSHQVERDLLNMVNRLADALEILSQKINASSEDKGT
jgi:hypothetical protein